MGIAEGEGTLRRQGHSRRMEDIVAPGLNYERLEDPEKKIEKLEKAILLIGLLQIASLVGVRQFFELNPSSAIPFQSAPYSAPAQKPLHLPPPDAAPPGPIPPQEAQPAPSAQQRSDAISDFLHQWASAWSRGDADSYLGFYSPEFLPGENLSRQQWQARRRERLAKQKEIHVSLRSVEIVGLDEDRATVRFVQDYQSDTLNEKDVVKEMQLQNTPDGWRIVREQQLRAN